MIRLLIADDQALVRGAIAALLGLEADIEVVAEVGRGDEVVDAVLGSSADVALLDVDMPGLDGIAAAAAVRAAAPDCRVLMVTTFGRPGYLRRALQAGAGELRGQGHSGPAAGGRRTPDATGGFAWWIRRWRRRPSPTGKAR